MLKDLGGLWSMLFPYALPQVFPFCYWLALVEDHFSRRVIGFRLFKEKPGSVQVRSFLGWAFHKTGTVARYIICGFRGRLPH